MLQTTLRLEDTHAVRILRLQSEGGTNRLTRASVLALTETLQELSHSPRPLIITGNERFFSAGADLAEIAELNGPSAYQFSKMGQQLMQTIADFPAPCSPRSRDTVWAADSTWRSPATIGSHRRTQFSDIVAQLWV